jgi:hypothetical protein
VAAAITNKKEEILRKLDTIGALDRRRAYGNDGNSNAMGAQGPGLRVLQL